MLLAERLDAVRQPPGAIGDRIEAQKEKIEAFPSADQEPSPEAGMNVMRRALAENDLVDLKNVRRRATRASKGV